jgi:NAD/NADP transhydrogenase beta subunit
MGAFIGVTGTWVLWALATPGDFLASGSPLLMVSLVVAALIGARIAYRVRSTRGLVAVLALTIGCAVFWVIGDSGWWAAGPPPPGAG